MYVHPYKSLCIYKHAHTFICLGGVCICVCLCKWDLTVYPVLQFVFNLTACHGDNSMLIHTTTLLPYLIVTCIPLWEYIPHHKFNPLFF